MHIPDGYLSPSTCAVGAAIAAPAWIVSARRLKKRLQDQEAPLLAAGAAFAFAIMMLNVPIPDGTTAHAVGGTLIAVILGPEAAVLAVTVALFIQAFFFGDGGVLALGANCLNMAVILPLTGYTVYRALWSWGRSRSRFEPWAAALGAYVGINLAALAASIELGIQPLLFHTRTGVPLYCPYHLQQTVPAMLLAHATVAGGVEAVVTGLVVAYLRCTNPTASETAEGRRSDRWVWTGLALLLLLAPLGLLAPGSAFGEDSAEDLKRAIGYVPAGLRHWSAVWRHALLPGYNLPGGSDTLSWSQVMGYWISALVGVAAILLAAFLLTRLLLRRGAMPETAMARRTAIQSGPAHGNPSLPVVPDWLLQPEALRLPCACSGRRATVPFLEKTLADAAQFMQQTLFAESLARRPGALQALDPRVKLVILLAFLLAAGLLHHLALLLALLLLALAASLASHVPPGLFLRRLGVIPLFTAFAALPALFNWVTPGDPLLVLARWPHPGHLGPFLAPPLLAITRQGVMGVLTLLARVSASIALAALLTLTTRWAELLKALRCLAAPRLFVFVLSMVYRYLFLFLQTASDIFVARKSRMVGRESTAAGRRFVAATAAMLFARSQALSQDVHAAMVSRGYRGEPRSLDEWRPGRIDALWALGSAALLVALWIGDRLLG